MFYRFNSDFFLSPFALSLNAEKKTAREKEEAKKEWAGHTTVCIVTAQA